MTTYLYRRGDGNEGNFPRAIIDVAETENPYAAIRALLANDYISGRKVRRHIIARTEIDGEADHALYATVHEGPNGESAYGAAWITADMSPVTEDDAAECYYTLPRMTLRDALDTGARRLYRKHAAPRT